MTLRLSLVKDPFWTRPALVGPDRAFQVVLAHDAGQVPALGLLRGDDSIPVSVDGRVGAKRGLSAWACHADESTPPGLYDLAVHLGGDECSVHGAVCLVPPQASDLTVLHCSDLHLLKPTPDGMQDRTGLVGALLDRINELCPDLVVCTGDLISRYDERKQALPAGCIRWQIAWLAEHLAKLRVPLYVTVGNHDVAFECTRSDWYTAMGGGWQGATDDLSADWGPYHLTMMDCFAHYDGDNRVLATSFTSHQLEWLANDLRSAANSSRRLLFAHYDYRMQLPALLDNLAIDIILYGHSRAMYPDLLARFGICDGHLADAEAYNLVHLGAGRISTERLYWSQLGDEWRWLESPPESDRGLAGSERSARACHERRVSRLVV